MVSCSLCQNLQSDVSPRVCIADNVASTGEEQIQVAGQFSGATEVERDVGTADAFFGDTAEQPFTAVLTGQQQL